MGCLASIGLMLIGESACAVEPGTVSAGVTALSHGLNRVSQNPSGKTDTLGTTYFNLDFKYHATLSADVLWSPHLVWMPDFLLPRSRDFVKTSFLIIGSPLTYRLRGSWDVSGGPSVVMYQIKGSGGYTTLSNGNTVSRFALPGRTETAKTMALLLGTSYNRAPYRASLELLTEGLLSDKKRTYSVMFTLAYSIYRF